MEVREELGENVFDLLLRSFLKFELSEGAEQVEDLAVVVEN